LKEEARNGILWSTRFGRGYGPGVRLTTERMDWNVSKLLKIWLKIYNLWSLSKDIIFVHF